MSNRLNGGLLSRNEAAVYLRMRPQTLACWASTKRYGLAYIKIGSRVFYRRSVLDTFLERQTVGATDSGQRRATSMGE